MILSKQISTFIFCITLNAVCFGQKLNLDSLKHLLVKTALADHVDILNTISSQFLWSSDIPRLMNLPAKDSVEYYAGKALKEAVKINYVKGIAEANYNCALIEWSNLFDFPALEKHARSAASLFEQMHDDKKLATCLDMLGGALWGESHFEEAITTLEKVSGIYKKNKYTSGLSNAYNFMSGVYLTWGYYEKGFRYSLLANQLNDKEALGYMANISFGLGDYQTAIDYLDRMTHFDPVIKIDGKCFLYILTYSAMKRYDSALRLCERWVDAINNHGVDPASKRMSLRWPDEYLGEIYLSQKKYEYALSKLNSALNLFEQSNDNNMVMRSLLHLAKCYEEIGKTKMALQNANQLMGLALKTGSRKFILDGSDLLWNLYIDSKKVDSAYYFLKIYTRVKDTLAADQSFFKAFVAIEKKQNQIESLQKEKEIQEVRLRNDSILKTVFLASIALILVLAFIIFRNISLKRRNESNRRELVENELQIQKLEVERAKSELRQQATALEMQALRAQMSPHFIFNSLNSINRFIMQNDKAQASEYLTKFSKLIRLILQHSEATLISLASELESLRLYLELEELRFNHHFNYRISVADDIDLDILKVPPLIIQPYVENAIWHGLMHKEEKGQLDINLHQDDNSLYVTITDDGIGRKRAQELASKSATKHKSMGLRITADRIAMMHGSHSKEDWITIHDLVNSDGSPAGTEVIIKLPVIND
ncbi:MAG: hypothetical protein C5B59_06180 [Bacteroidetes bacterium]|nr:MAG: hypothetical protein C5B59_06180 [Bacteroidota bacterium]